MLTPTFAGVFRNSNPDLALKLAKHDAGAKARKASQLLATNPDVAAIRMASKLAQEALARDPTSAEAVRTLGLAAANDDLPSAQRMFVHAERLSRRDFPTQIWLIEHKVGQEDVAGALVHYDRALRTSRQSEGLLLPILVSATADDALVKPIARLLATDPPWSAAFYRRFIEHAPSPDNAVRLLHHLSDAGKLPQSHLPDFIQWLAHRKQFAAAWEVYKLAKPEGEVGVSDQVRNGDFEVDNRLPPIDWQIEAGAALGGELRIRSGDAKNRVLFAYAQAGGGGAIARQVLMLPPGPYRLRWAAGYEEPSKPAQLQWLIVCATEPGQELAAIPVSLRERNERGHEGAFTVPGGCGAQWLMLEIRSDFDAGSREAWVDRVAVRRGQ